MIFGLEGLPGSGKSLEAMQNIHDALLAGRTIVTNIYGLDRKLISETMAMPLESVERLLIGLEAPGDLDDEQKVVWVKQQFYAHRLNDCLWIWDEINQFWPPDRNALPAEWAKFVTEHRHLGIDILIMGQDLTELHATWRKRLQRYTRLTKKDMMGKENEYHWSSLSNSGRGRFKQTASGSKPYNQRFYGWYKSVRDETGNKANYKDGRFSIFQAKHKFWAAVYGIGLLAGAVYMWQWFHPATPEKPASAASSKSPAELQKDAQDRKNSELAAAKPKPEPVAESKPEPKPELEKKRDPIDYLDKIANSYKLRVGAVVERSEAVPGKRKWDFVLEALDDTYHVRERFGAGDVYALGWDIEKLDYGFKISKAGVEYVLRPWPIDVYGRVSSAGISAAREAGRTPGGLPPPAGPRTETVPDVTSLVGAAGTAQGTGQTFTVVPDSEYSSRPWRTN